MNKNKILAIAKWVWSTIVIVGIVYYFSKNADLFLTYIHNISLKKMMLSLVFLIIGKLLIAEMSRQSIISRNWHPSYKKMLSIYSTIQLSKYLPGGIWHFVGRFGMYRLNGMDNRESSISMVVENIWLVSSAFLFGVILSLANPVFLNLLGTGLVNSQYKFLIPICIVFWIVLNFLINKYVLKKKRIVISTIYDTLIQSAIWLSLGVSFLVLFPDQYLTIEISRIAIGGFSLGWAVGYITIFAPSGIGVREAVITAILSTHIQPQEAAIYATVSRLVWIVAEICLGLFCEIVFESGNLLQFFKARQK